MKWFAIAEYHLQPGVGSGRAHYLQEGNCSEAEREREKSDGATGESEASAAMNGQNSLSLHTFSLTP